MTDILILFYSSREHIETLAEARGEGARNAGAEVDLRRVRETAPPPLVEALNFRTDGQYPLIEGPDALAGHDGIAIGAPTRSGRMPSRMGALPEACGGLWRTGALVGKAGAAFTSTATQRGGQETTQFSIITNLLQFGMAIIALDHGFAGRNGVAAVHGNSPPGASTTADNDGSRRPSENALDGARHQGPRLARTAAKLSV